MANTIKTRKKEEISRIVIHCSDTMSDPSIGVDKIREWHRAKGFLDVGYHFVIRTDGRIEAGRDILSVGAHARGYNKSSIGICLVGGRDELNKPDSKGQWLTRQQCQMLSVLVLYLCACFSIKEILGHYELDSSKTCPNFDVVPFKEFIYGELRRNEM